MNRSEVAVTLLGLVATFLMPWPGQESSSRVEPPAVQAAANPAACVAAPTASVDTGHCVVPGRAASDRIACRG